MRLTFKTRAFTLIEILVVLLIIGIVVGAVSLTLIHHNNNASPVAALNILRNRLQLAEQETSLQNITLGCAMSTAGYQFMHYINDPLNPRWEVISGHGLESSSWPSFETIQLTIGNQTSQLLPDDFPDTPQIILLPSGEITEFSLNVGKNYVLTANPAGQINVQKNDATT